MIEFKRALTANYREMLAIGNTGKWKWEADFPAHVGMKHDCTAVTEKNVASISKKFESKIQIQLTA